jgi:hypothetical protein
MPSLDEGAASSSKSVSSGLPASLRGLPGPRKEKIPVVKFLLESSRHKKTVEGAKLLREAKTMLKDIREKLDEPVRKAFDLRIDEYVGFFTLLNGLTDSSLGLWLALATNTRRTGDGRNSYTSTSLIPDVS